MRHILTLTIFTLASLSTSAIAEDDLKLSGFMRLIGGYLDTNQAEFKGYDDSVTLSPSSLIAFQADYQPLDKLSFTGQVVARADDDNDSGIEWLYLTWEPISSIQIKAGKLRTPFFTLSDYTDVGYAYHWINPPAQVYNAFLYRKYDGIDFTWGYTGDGYDIGLELYTGESDGEANIGPNSVDYLAENIQGIIGSINIGNLRFRISRYRGDAILDLPQLTSFSAVLRQSGFNASAESLSTEGSGVVNQAGFIYDNLKYFLHGEWVGITPDWGVAPDIESYYLSAGYNFSPFTIHLTFANGKADGKEPVDEIPIGLNPMLDQLAFTYQQIVAGFGKDNMESWTLGSRWDIKPNLALKAEWTRINGRPNQTSYFTIIDQNFDRKANLYLLGLEWVF